jgi:hypothetical protein
MDNLFTSPPFGPILQPEFPDHLLCGEPVHTAPRGDPHPVQSHQYSPHHRAHPESAADEPARRRSPPHDRLFHGEAGFYSLPFRAEHYPPGPTQSGTEEDYRPAIAGRRDCRGEASAGGGGPLSGGSPQQDSLARDEGAQSSLPVLGRSFRSGRRLSERPRFALPDLPHPQSICTFPAGHLLSTPFFALVACLQARSRTTRSRPPFYGWVW